MQPDFFKKKYCGSAAPTATEMGGGSVHTLHQTADAAYCRVCFSRKEKKKAKKAKHARTEALMVL
jgi:hypothetical protein